MTIHHSPVPGRVPHDPYQRTVPRLARCPGEWMWLTLPDHETISPLVRERRRHIDRDRDDEQLDGEDMT